MSKLHTYMVVSNGDDPFREWTYTTDADDCDHAVKKALDYWDEVVDVIAVYQLCWTKDGGYND
jgi:hypothetical protein